ncbi:putative serpin-Z8 [Dichanthelium oligosanthes]|uniref:Putative serpin-Z8 n=1 Tax=Dichanthelium oligosanthes TaxID=888268 RepID=A0A1E5V0Y5_9POAL|nr:putative serpin-Z8 [Dichanthelium oligosanthes]
MVFRQQVPQYSMYVFLPDVRDGLPDLVGRIVSMPGFWRYRLPDSWVAVGEFRLPKFKLSFSCSLTGVLRGGMGIRAAFDARQADLSDLAIDDGSGMPLFADEIYHKAVIEQDSNSCDTKRETSHTTFAMARKRRRRTEIERRTNRAGLTALSLRLTMHLAPADGDSADAAAAAAGGDANLAFSPVSIYSALALLAAGAHGATLQELLDALGGESRDDIAAFARGVAESALADRSGLGGPTVAFACGAWHDAAWALLPEFREAAAASYKAEARAVDFSNEPEKAVSEINGAVAAATDNHVDSILDSRSVNTLTSLVVASAIYFKGKWEAPFAKSQTRVGKFYRLDGTTTDVPFMCSARSQFIAIRNGYKVLKLPYKSPAPPLPPPPPPRRRKKSSQSNTGDEPSKVDDDELPKYSLCIFLPDERDGLAALVEKFASGPGFWHYRLPTVQVPVGDFRLPKFKLPVSGSIRHVLTDDMGINSAFNAGDADLSDMAKRDDDPGTPLYVGDVCHKVVLEVNEGGNTATVATGSSMLCGANAVMDQPVTVDFVADHPFLFFLIEEVSRAIVFVGRVLDPLISGL